MSAQEHRIRISAIAPDWVDKGCHLHVDSVEIALRPDHLGGIVCRPIFSSTTDVNLQSSCRIVFTRLREDRVFRSRLGDALERAMTFLLSIEGEKLARARGRLFEFRMLILALERMGS